MEGARSKPADEFLDRPFDVVVTVCDSAAQDCPTWPHARRVEHWPIEDPSFGPDDPATRYDRFLETRDELRRRIDGLAASAGRTGLRETAASGAGSRRLVVGRGGIGLEPVGVPGEVPVGGQLRFLDEVLLRPARGPRLPGRIEKVRDVSPKGLQARRVGDLAVPGDDHDVGGDPRQHAVDRREMAADGSRLLRGR